MMRNIPTMMRIMASSLRITRAPHREPLPNGLADSHKAGAQFPSPLVGEDRLGRSPSEEGGAGHRAPGRSRPAVHQPQGQGQRMCEPLSRTGEGQG